MYMLNCRVCLEVSMLCNECTQTSKNLCWMPPKNRYSMDLGKLLLAILLQLSWEKIHVHLKMLYMYDLFEVQCVFKVIAGFVQFIENLSWNLRISFSRPGKWWNLIKEWKVIGNNSYSRSHDIVIDWESIPMSAVNKKEQLGPISSLVCVWWIEFLS